MYLVVECSAMVAPSASGFWRKGVAKVLSTTSCVPRRRAISPQAAMSTRRSNGLVGLSIQSMRVSASNALSISSSRVASTKENRTPKRGITCVKSR